MVNKALEGFFFPKHQNISRNWRPHIIMDYLSLSLSHRNILQSILLTKNPLKLIPIFMFGYRGLHICGHAPLIGHSSRVLHKRKDKSYQILNHSLIRKHGLNYNKYHCWLGKKKISKTKNCNNKVFKPQMKLWMVLIINKIIF